MCEYCKKSKSLYYDKGNPIIREVYIELDGTMSVASHISDNHTMHYGINFKINYCPMCGRKIF